MFFPTQFRSPCSISSVFFPYFVVLFFTLMLSKLIYHNLVSPHECSENGAWLRSCINSQFQLLTTERTSVKPLAPKDIYIYIHIYICRTAQLTSRRYILTIYSTNILTEYFKHAAHSPFFFLFKTPFIS